MFGTLSLAYDVYMTKDQTNKQTNKQEWNLLLTPTTGPSLQNEDTQRLFKLMQFMHILDYFIKWLVDTEIT
jgi:hypothetical protein